MTPDTPATAAGATATAATPADVANLDPEEARKRARKLGVKASQLKLDLHDLAEDLPLGWENILDVARRTYDAYAEIARLEGRAKEASG
jgi:hypothetical protein